MLRFFQKPQTYGECALRAPSLAHHAASPQQLVVDLQNVLDVLDVMTSSSEDVDETKEVEPLSKKFRGGKRGRKAKKPTFLAHGNRTGMKRHEWLLRHADAKEFRRVLRVDRGTFDYVVRRLKNPKDLDARAFAMYYSKLGHDTGAPHVLLLSLDAVACGLRSRRCSAVDLGRPVEHRKGSVSGQRPLLPRAQETGSQ